MAPPPAPGGWVLRFANNDAARGWEALCRQAAGNTRKAFETIEADPCPRQHASRHHPLRDELATARYGGKPMPHWQYEVTAAGRVWYLIDEERRTCWLTLAVTGHPKATG
ncbi:hypothetical protein [Actinoplanes sp. RD1]|uniref:hypothetical protein n=1 Tax=Actinoplanes sp. RD1 TaxID=3064538 RepID=UPI0027420F2C|nr:hypothetical protein [Actinoplanes sp. RD1]